MFTLSNLFFLKFPGGWSSTYTVRASTIISVIYGAAGRRADAWFVPTNACLGKIQYSAW